MSQSGLLIYGFTNLHFCGMIFTDVSYYDKNSTNTVGNLGLINYIFNIAFTTLKLV